MVVVNPHLETLTAALKNFLTLSAPYKHLIYAGHFFSGNGTWVLQDDTFSISNFAQMCKDKELEEALKQQNGGQVTFYFSKSGEWKTESLKKLDIFKNSVVKVSSDEKLIDNTHGILQFATYIASFINAKTSEELLRTSDVVGSIRFNKPTLYIFPGSEGDSSLFGVSGFNLLVNGGYSRKACFWDLTRHLDRIDSFLMTHLGTDNVFGISTLLKRKCTEYIHPEIGYMYLNGSDKVSHSAVVNGQSEKEPNLCINLSEEGSRLIEYAKQLGHVPQPCTRPMSSQPLQPINLYHKVGHGSLNMYVLNPVSDSKELKDFYQHWNKHLSEHGSMHQIPIQNQLSVCTLLVWQPADLNEKITRIFFPGNAPQYKILEGLEKLKHLDILKHASCTAKDLESKPASAASKRNSLAAKPPPTKPAKSTEPTTTRSTRPTADVKKSSEVRASKSNDVRASKTTDVKASAEKKKPEPKKTEVKSTPPPKARAPPPSRTNKVAKEDENKKTAKKDEKASKPTSKTATTKPPAKNGTKEKKESPKKSPEKAAENIPEKPVEKEEDKPEVIEEPPKVEKSPVVEEAPPVTEAPQEESPKVEEPPVAVVEPIQDKALLDLSPNEPVAQPEGDAVTPEQQTPADEPSSQTSSDHPSPEDLSPGELMAMSGSGLGNKMMDSFHESYHGDLMSNGTPTEEQQGQTLADLGIYDDNVDVQPEALPEPVAIPPQESSFPPDMIPTSDRKNQEEKPLISGMAPIEPDVVQGLQNDYTTSTPSDERPPMEFDSSEKSGSTDPIETRPQDPMQRSFYGDDLGPEGSEQFESITESESALSSKTGADVPELDQTAEDLMQKSLGDQDQIFDQQADDVVEETEMQGTSPPDVVQVQEKFEEENIVESETKMQEAIREEEEDEEVSPDENDSQVDVRERNLEDLEENKEKLDEEKAIDDESPYAFENKGFSDGVEAQEDSSPEIQEKGLSEEREVLDEMGSSQGSQSPDEGVVEDKFAEEEKECTESPTESGIGITVDQDEQSLTEQPDEEVLEESQYTDSLEVSNIPEAFEKDETPDPRDVQAGQSDNLIDIQPESTESPMENMDPYDPFCSTSPKLPSMQPSDPLVQFEEQSQPKSMSRSPDDRPINGFGFDPYEPQAQDPFDGATKESFGEEKELSTNPFDPEAEWGKPMGLPSPPPPDAGAKPSSAKKNTKPDTARNGAKKEPPKARTGLNTSVNGPSKTSTSKARPASAVEPRTKPAPSAGAKRPVSANVSSRSSPATKSPPLPPFTPFYVDLTYIPNHGNPSYSDIEFFKRIRARYYVLSTLSPNPQTLTALMEAKETWENKNAEVTLIPTYDNDTLRHWMGLNRDKLNELNIDLAPSASRCTIHLQDHETSCSAYRLEF